MNRLGTATSAAPAIHLVFSLASESHGSKTFLSTDCMSNMTEKCVCNLAKPYIHNIRRMKQGSEVASTVGLAYKRRNEGTD